MSGRVAIWLALAAVGCADATLGGPTPARVDAPTTSDASVADAAVDAPIDARPCMGGNVAAVAPDGSCLVHFTSPATYVNARTGCMSINAHLAYLKDATIDAFAENFIGTVDTWIGGNDLATEGAFVWDDGTAFAFTAWHAGEPNNGNNSYQEDCVIIAGSRTDKMWDDRPCDGTEVANAGSYAYLCQY